MTAQPIELARETAPCSAIRHGDGRAYRRFGCRCPEARRAHTREWKDWNLRRLRHGPQRVSSVGTKRRIQAMLRAGWSRRHIAEAAGWKDTARVSGVLASTNVLVGTRDLVAAVYDELLGPWLDRTGPSRETARAAKRRGWPSAMDWFDVDIDDPAATPTEYIDHAVVARVVDGDTSLRPTPAEKAEIVRQMLRRGHSRAECQRRLRVNSEVLGELLDIVGAPRKTRKPA